MLKQWIVFSCALIGCSISEYPALFTDSPPAERRQTLASYMYDKNGSVSVCHGN